MFSPSYLFLAINVWFIFWVWLFNYYLNIDQGLIALFFVSILVLNILLYNKKKVLIIFISFFICSFIWVFYTHHYFLSIQENNKFIEKFFYFDEIKVEAIVKNQEKTKENSKIYKIVIHSLDEYDIKTPIFWFIELPFNVNIYLWDKIEFTSKINKINNFSHYNYKLHLSSKNIYFTSYPYGLKVLNRGEKFYALEKIDELRKEILSVLSSLYSKDEWVLLWWILIWVKENMNEELEKNFNNSGLTHIIAVSWYNITILILFLSYILVLFPQSVRITFILLFLCFFVFLVWLNPPVIRASIMWFLSFLILTLGRKPLYISLVSFTLALMLLINPFSLWYDISFQLSFLAIIWVVYFWKILEKMSAKITNVFALKQTLILTFSALIFTIPISIFYFWQMSIIALISNLIVAPTIPIIMLFWWVSIFVNLVYEPVSYIFSFITYLFLRFDIESVYFFWQLPWATLRVPEYYYLPFVFMYYMFLFCFIIIQKKE